jgi:hypothetical protein
MSPLLMDGTLSQDTLQSIVSSSNFQPLIFLFFLSFLFGGTGV